MSHKAAAYQLVAERIRTLEAQNRIHADERSALERALSIGEQYGIGNVMGWLATLWAVKLRDEEGLPEAAAIDAVSNRGPYPLPKKEASRE